MPRPSKTKEWPNNNKIAIYQKIKTLLNISKQMRKEESNQKKSLGKKEGIHLLLSVIVGQRLP